MDNPYSKLIGIMRKQGTAFNPSSVMLAELVSLNFSQVPYKLVIKSGDLEIDEDNILLDSELFDPTKLAAGDTVAVLPTADNQTYIVLAKVVSLDG